MEFAILPIAFSIEVCYTVSVSNEQHQPPPALKDGCEAGGDDQRKEQQS